MEEFRTPLSRAEAILENILGADNRLRDPLSNVEEILLSILNDTPYEKEPETLIEEMLLAIKEGTEMDAIAKNRVEEILLAIIHGEEYTKLPLSRFEELLIEWLKESAVTEKFLDFAPILSFSDSAGKPLVECKVKIEPVQDLHGYDHPWPAGGGKNKFGCADGTYAVGATRTVIVTSGVWEYRVNLTAESKVFLPAATINAMGISLLKAGTYTFSLASDATVSSVISSAELNLADGQVISNGGTFTINADTAVVSITTPDDGRYIKGTYTCQIQIESGTAATAYEPYSNICPISGHDSMTVTRAGKNLITEEPISSTSGLVPNSAGTFNSSTNYSVYVFSVKSKTTVWFSCSTDVVGYILSTDSTDITTSTKNYGRTALSSSSITYPVSKYMDGSYLVIAVTNASDLDNISVQYDTSSADYTRTVGETYTIELGDTIYGGTLDITTGELVVDRAMVDLGTLRWGMYPNYPGLWFTNNTGLGFVEPRNTILPDAICSKYKRAISRDIGTDGHKMGEFALASPQRIYVADESYDSSDSFTSSLSGVQLVYKLAEPIEIQLTPQQITTLLGGNTLYADTGDISVKYLAKKS